MPLYFQKKKKIEIVTKLRIKEEVWGLFLELFTSKDYICQEAKGKLKMSSEFSMWTKSPYFETRTSETQEYMGST